MIPFVVGTLTGLSGPDVAVLTTVLPAVLTAAGTVAAYRAFRSDDNGCHAFVIFLLTIMFSVARLADTDHGK